MAKYKTKYQIIDGKKLCSTCKLMLPVESYVKNSISASGLEYSCKDCKRKLASAYYPGRNAKVYGITVEDFNRMLEEQDGRCAICNQVPRGSRAGGWRIDHCHATGKVRALLCNGCNAGLGHFADDPVRLAEAIQYLARHSKDA